MPETADARDVEAARQATFERPVRTAWTNSWWMDPVFLGRYPGGSALLRRGRAGVPHGDLALISEPIDFFGVNIYQGTHVRSADGQPEVVPLPVGHPITAFDWPVTPDALYWGPRFFYDRYRKPIVITENGLSCRDWVSLDGKVHDPQRIDFIARHLIELRRAMNDGVPVEGYFHWSFIDNFEWAHGYKHRFGLIYCDYPTEERILKDSARFYRDVIGTNGASLE